jgi:hypothetical protein
MGTPYSSSSIAAAALAPTRGAAITAMAGALPCGGPGALPAPILAIAAAVVVDGGGGGWRSAVGGGGAIGVPYSSSSMAVCACASLRPFFFCFSPVFLGCVLVDHFNAGLLNPLEACPRIRIITSILPERN